MADSLISDKQLEQLIASSELDLTEALKYFPEAVRNVQMKSITDAIQSKDQGKLKQLAHQSPEMSNLVSAIQNHQNIQRLALAIPAIKKAEDKKAKGENLSPKESALLTQKAGWEKGVEWCKAKYPKVFEKHSETTSNSAQISNEQEDKKEIEKGKEIFTALKEGNREKDEQANDLADIQGLLNMKEGKGGYLDEFSVDKKDLKSTEWSKVLDKGIEHINKIGGGKDAGEIVMQTVEMAILAPLDMLTEMLNQMHANFKENEKIKSEKLKDFIDNNLKTNGLTKTKLASELSHDTQVWLTNDPEYHHLPKEGPYNKYQKALIEKREFAAGLPKKADGNIDLNKMSRSQKKRFATYVFSYANMPRFKNYIYEMSGIKLHYDDIKKIATNAAKMKTIQVDHTQMRIAEPQPRIKANVEQPTPKPQIAAPKAAQTSEQAKLRDETLKSVKLEDLKPVIVSGNLKNPVVMEDGKKLPVSDSTKEALKNNAEKAKNRSRENSEAINQLRQRQQQLSDARNNVGKSGNTPSRGYSNSSDRGK